MNHAHSPTKFILKDATKDIFNNLWTYVDKNDGTAKCAICGKLISVPEHEAPTNVIRKLYGLNLLMPVIFGLIGYGLRCAFFWYNNYDLLDSVWGILLGVVLGIIMIAASLCIRRLVICHHWAYNEWTEVDLSRITRAELEKEFRYYRYALTLNWSVIFVIYIFYKGYTLSLL